MALRKIVLWSAVLAIGGFAAASNAVAGGTGAPVPQVPQGTIQYGGLHVGQPVKPPHVTYPNNRPPAYLQTTKPGNGNFGMSGPYIGLKYIGNQ
ncbi:MAG: hypothetical protein J0H40_17135 [Rhizobiales bacterium]|nr:hypothetical protein [Hyphomicrobiales bacterium]